MKAMTNQQYASAGLAGRTIVVLLAAGLVASAAYAIVPETNPPSATIERLLRKQAELRAPSLARGLAALTINICTVGMAGFVGRKVLRLHL
jgi:hypothetical protein